MSLRFRQDLGDGQGIKLVKKRRRREPGQGGFKPKVTPGDQAHAQHRADTNRPVTSEPTGAADPTSEPTGAADAMDLSMVGADDFDGADHGGDNGVDVTPHPQDPGAPFTHQVRTSFTQDSEASMH